VESLRNPAGWLAIHVSARTSCPVDVTLVIEAPTERTYAEGSGPAASTAWRREALPDYGHVEFLYESEFLPCAMSVTTTRVARNGHILKKRVDRLSLGGPTCRPEASAQAPDGGYGDRANARWPLLFERGIRPAEQCRSEAGRE